MEHVNVVLHDGVTSVEIQRVGLGVCVATREPERAAPANDGHLPDRIEHLVPSQQAQVASVIFPFHERQVHHHQQAQLVLGSRRVYSLGLAHELGLGVRPNGERIVHHHHGPERRLGGVGHGGLRHPHGGGIAAADDVVEVEVEVAQLLLAEAKRRRRENPREAGGLSGDEEGEEDNENEGNEDGDLGFRHCWN